MKKKGFIAVVIFCLLLAGGAWALYGGSGTQKKDGGGQAADGSESSTDSEKIKLTVWLDEDNEYELRKQIRYNHDRRESSGPGGISKEAKEKYFPDIQWELVRKNYLSPEQYRQELAEALEKGEGPDIIYMDTYNGVDPKGLMEAGALADLGDIAALWKEVKYVPGALEPGQQDGKTYVMPLYMECPLVFGLTEELEQAGIQTEEMYGSLEEFLDALLKAQEKTGKQVFENDAAIDWLEQNYMPDERTADIIVRGNEYETVSSNWRYFNRCGSACIMRLQRHHERGEADKQEPDIMRG